MANTPSETGRTQPQPEQPHRADLISRLCRVFAQRARAAAGWAEHRADTRQQRLAAQARTTPPTPTSAEQININRRRFFGAAAIAAASAATVAAGVKNRIDTGLAARAKVEKEKLLGVPETHEWEASELTGNWVASFEQIHGALDNRHVVFVDQNGNIIGEPIEIKDHIFPGDTIPTPVIDETNGKLNQEWLNKWRKELKKKYPTIHLDLTEDNEHPSVYQVRNKINNGETVFCITWENAQQEVSENGHKTTKLKYAREAFKASTLPPELQELMIFGICGQEAMFRDDLVSKVGAKGAWQFMKKTAMELGLIQTEIKTIRERVKIKKAPKRREKRGKKPKEVWVTRTRKVTTEKDYREDFIKSTDTAVKYCESLYKDIKNNSDYVELAKRFHLSEEDSLYPCVIASYNNGAFRVKNMIKWFLENYSLERVQKEIGNGPYGMDIFTHMTIRYRASKRDPKYGKQSKDYFPKAVSMRNLFVARMENPAYLTEFELYEPPEIPDTTFDTISKSHPKIPEAIALSTGTALGLAAGMISSPKPVGRRGALLAGASLVGATVGLSAASQSCGGEIKTTDQEDQEKPEFDFGTIKYDKQLGQRLLDTSRLFNPTAQNKEVRLPRRIQGTKIEPWIEKHSSKLHQYQDIEEVKKAAKAGKLKPLTQYDSMHYRCRGVGISEEDSLKNAEDFLNVHPNMPAIIKEIDERLNAELVKLGFPENYWARLIVTCGIRPVDYNSKIKGSSPTSAHIYGIGFDLSRSRFDIIDKRTNTFYDSPDKLGVTQKHRITAQMYAALTRVLQEMSTEGKIFAMLERSHLHIAIKQI